MSTKPSKRASIVGQLVMLEDYAGACREYEITDTRLSAGGHYVYGARWSTLDGLRGIRIELSKHDFFVVEVSGDVAASLRAQGFTICGDKRASA